MKSPAHIVWKELEPSPALASRIATEVEMLDHTYDRITRCRVAIAQPHRRHRHGRHFAVKIEVSVPGRLLAVTGDPVAHRSSEDPYAAVNEAFGAMRRQLAEYADYRHRHRRRAARARRPGVSSATPR